MTLNIKKSNFVIFRPYQKKVDTQINIKLIDNDTGHLINLERKENVKYLGILIDSHLSWRNHIDYISLKISKTVGLFAKLRHTVPINTLLTLYWSLIHPYLNYGIIAWGHASRLYLNKLLLLQKRVIRFIFFAKQRESAIPLFIKSNVPPVNLMYCQTVANLVHDVTNENCPKNILKLFLYHSYETRSASANNLYTQSSRLKTQLNSFSRIGVKLWNSIPSSIRERPKFTFKKIVRNFLFSMLKSEGWYLGVERVTQLFRNGLKLISFS